MSHQQNNVLNRFQNYQNSGGRDFYSDLQHYSPVCGSSDHRKVVGDRQPQAEDECYKYFLANDGWWKSFVCILLMNVVFVVTYFRFVLDERPAYLTTNSDEQQYILKHERSANYELMQLLMIITLSLINVFYLLTQFLNPGVRDLSSIPTSQLNSASKVQYCEKCQYYRTNKFVHCSECQVCIWNYDHHCGFFGKCIGGRAQTYAFYGFLISVTIGFLTLLGCMCVQLGSL